MCITKGTSQIFTFFWICDLLHFLLQFVRKLGEIETGGNVRAFSNSGLGHGSYGAFVPGSVQKSSCEHTSIESHSVRESTRKGMLERQGC